MKAVYWRTATVTSMSVCGGWLVTGMLMNSTSPGGLSDTGSTRSGATSIVPSSKTEHKKTSRPASYAAAGIAHSELVSRIAGLDAGRDLPALAALFRRLTELNPEQAIRSLNALGLPLLQTWPTPDGQVGYFSPRDYLLNAVLATWANTQPEDAAAWIATNVKPPSILGNETVAVLAAHDPLLAARTILKVSNPANAAAMMKDVYPELLKSPAGTTEARDIAEKLARSSPRSSALTWFFIEWQHRDTAAALTWVASLPLDLLTGDSTLAGSVSKASPSAGFALAQRSVAGKVDSEAFRDKFQDILEHGYRPPAWGSRLDFEVKALMESYKAWAQQEPEAAAAWLKLQPVLPANDALAAEVPAMLAAKSMAQGIAALNGLDPRQQAAAARNLAAASSQAPLAEVLHAAEEIHQPARDTYLVESLLRLERQEAGIAAAHANSITDPAIRQRLVTRGIISPD